MITAQDIREKGFEKVKFNGYDMASVDDFLDELADDVAASQKENAVLKSKMKVLVDKIEDYRANEEALNMAVISAQKLAVQIEAEARQRAAAMLADAERQVRARVGSIEEETARQERRLADAKAAANEFFNTVRNLCNAQIKKIDAIASGIIPQPEASEAAGASGVEDAVRSIEKSVARIRPEAQMNIDITPADKASPADDLGSTQSFSF